MPVLTAAADVLTRKLPKLLTANAHLAADYAFVGSFAAGGAWFWRRNRRAALASWICGGSLLAVTMLTSYPGRRKKFITFPLHGKIEIVLTAMIATMPEFLRLEDDNERHYFTSEAGILTLVSNLTSFASDDRHP
jgi:hypothetical protein